MEKETPQMKILTQMGKVLERCRQTKAKTTQGREYHKCMEAPETHRCFSRLTPSMHSSCSDGHRKPGPFLQMQKGEKNSKTQLAFQILKNKSEKTRNKGKLFSSTKIPTETPLLIWFLMTEECRAPPRKSKRRKECCSCTFDWHYTRGSSQSNEAGK